MKQKHNEADVLGVILSLQDQIAAMDRKLDALMARSVNQSASPVRPQTPVNNQPKAKVSDPNKGRPMFTAICADCKKECRIPFKPNGERPVYCQDCFSRRKMISLSKTGMEPAFKPAAPVVQAPVVEVTKSQEPKAKARPKKVVAVKKTVTKKKAAKKK